MTATPAIIVDAWDETPGLRSVRVQLDDERVAHHSMPGQIVKAGIEGPSSTFALSTAPNGREVELLIRRGDSTTRLVDYARPGATLLVTAPHGPGFPVQKAREKDVVLFAAGSGISAVRALVQHLLAHRGQFGRMRLYYGQREVGDFAYAREHEAWGRTGLELVLCCSQPPSHWSGPTGYAQAVAHADGLGGISAASAATFVAGSKALVTGVRDLLAPAGAAPLTNY